MRATLPVGRNATVTCRVSRALTRSSSHVMHAGRQCIFTVDGVLFDDSRQLTTMAYKAALRLFPEQAEAFGSNGPWPFYKRLRQVIPAVECLRELSLLVRMLADEGIVPVGPYRDPDNPIYRTRRTRALNTSSIVDPENALYLIETVQRRWKISDEQLTAAFREAREEVVMSSSKPAAPSAAGDTEEDQLRLFSLDDLTTSGLQKTHSFAVEAVNAIGAQPGGSDRVVILTADSERVTSALLEGAGVDSRHVEIVQGETELDAFKQLMGRRDQDGDEEQQRLLFSDRYRFLSSCYDVAKDVRPYLIDWGYSTASLRAQAESGRRLQVIDSVEFVAILGLQDSRAVMDGIAWK